jgi:NADP-reducing hydrogenase subunit HndB
MSKMTLDDLRKLRGETKKAMSQREAANKDTRVIIGMGTCGIAAGAKVTFDAFLEEIEKNNLENVVVLQTGCMGLCYSEPTVEVIVPNMPGVVYGKVDAEVARRIVRKHIIGKLLINDHIYDKPSADVVKPASEAGK